MDYELLIPPAAALVISFLSVPVIGKISKKLKIIAEINKRTVHHGIIARDGGYAIYFSFIICAAWFLKTDQQINSILIGGFIVFMTGFIDDIYTLKPKQKLLGQLLGTLVVIFYGGITLGNLPLSFLPDQVVSWISILISIGWIIGITNAINLIDGLDGLCAGVSMIVLSTISIISLRYGRTDIASLSFILVGSIGGFLFYNFHPAKIFMGDCGALFIGFMISSISLLGFGFKSTAFFTLGAPIVVLTVPIMDTLIAMIRRKLQNKSIGEADRGHIHHQLMFTLKLGHLRSVLVLYFATLMFSLCAYWYIDHPTRAIILFVILFFIFDLFVEMTGMVAQEYKPILTIANIFIKSDKLPQIKDTKPYEVATQKIFKGWKKFVIICLVIAMGFGVYHIRVNRKQETPINNNSEIYKKSSKQTKLMKQIYKKIVSESNPPKKNKLCGYIAAYVAADYFTIANKKEDEIGGSDYFYKDKKDTFIAYAKAGYYKNVNELIAQGCKDTIVDYHIRSVENSNITLSDLEDYNYYDVTLTVTFNQDSSILQVKTLDVVITLIEKDDQLSVISLDYFLSE